MGQRGDRKPWRRGILTGSMGWMLWAGLAGARVDLPAGLPLRENGHRTSQKPCPATPEGMMPLLLRDLPGYVNRVALPIAHSVLQCC